MAELKTKLTKASVDGFLKGDRTTRAGGRIVRRSSAS